MIADAAKHGEMSDEVVDLREERYESASAAEGRLDVRRWNEKTDGTDGAQPEPRCKDFSELANSRIPDVEGKLINFCGGVAGKSTEGFFCVGVPSSLINLK